MSLAAKLGFGLSLVLAFILWGTLWVDYRLERRSLERSRDASIQGSIEGLASHCAAGPDWERRCLDGMRFLPLLTVPRAFRQALVLDRKGRVLLHTDFLKRDRSLLGSQTRDPVLLELVGLEEPAVRSGQVLEPVRQKAYSWPLLGPRGRFGTLVALYSEDGLQDTMRWLHAQALQRWARACALGAGLGLLLSLGLTLYILSPLDPLVEAARRVARGDWSFRVPEGRKDELGLLAREFNRMTRSLAELEELKEGFVAQVTHDLKNPLNAIISQLDVLARGYQGPSSGEQVESVRLAASSAMELSELIDNILESTKLRAGGVRLEREETALGAVVEDVLASFRTRAEELKVLLSAALPVTQGRACVDPRSLRRILANLVANALRFTPAGGRVWVETRRGESGMVEVAVCDTGVGIPKARLTSLSERFFQVPENRAQARYPGGTGLGLYICRCLIEAHGGAFRAESEPGRGSRFVFTLPERCPGTV